MPGSIRVGSLLGIPFHINASWLVVFGLVTAMLAGDRFPATYPNWPAGLSVAVALLTSLLFFVSIVLHELAHSVVARRLNLPVKSITLFILGGVAQIGHEGTRPAAEMAMAAAGPLASFALAALFGAIWAAFGQAAEPIQALCAWLTINNLVLGIFNMLPGFPMDGGRVFRSLLWWATGNHRVATRIAVWFGRGMALTMVGAGVAIIVFSRAQAFDGVWLAIVGWFLNLAAGGSQRQANVRDALTGYTAGDLMTHHVVTVPAEMAVQRAVEEYATTTGGLAVVEGAVLRGLVGTDGLQRVPKAARPQTSVSDAMTPIAKLPVIDPDMPALAVLEEMDERRVNELPVVRGGMLEGVVTRLGLLRPLELHREAGW